MSLSRKLYLTAVVMWRSLVPQRLAPQAVVTVAAGGDGSALVQLAVSAEISRFLADPGHAMRKSGEFACLFTGCMALAAPFVLFRLKRQGFSNCRVTTGQEGLLVEGRR